MLQILELKEAAACRARSMALAAARQLHEFMSQLNGEYQLAQRLMGPAAHQPAAHPGTAAAAAAGGARGSPQSQHRAGSAAGSSGAAVAGSPVRPRGLHLHPVPPRERGVQQEQQLEQGLQHIPEAGAAAPRGPSVRSSPPPAVPLLGSNSNSMAPGSKIQGPSPAEPAS